MLTQFLIMQISNEDWAEILQSSGHVYFIPKAWLPACAIAGDEIFMLPFRSRENPDKGKHLNIVLAPRKVFKDNAKASLNNPNTALSNAA